MASPSEVSSDNGASFDSPRNKRSTNDEDDNGIVEGPCKRMRLVDEGPVHIVQASPPLEHPPPTSSSSGQATFLADLPDDYESNLRNNSWIDDIGTERESQAHYNDGDLSHTESFNNTQESSGSRMESRSTPILDKQSVDINHFRVSASPQTPPSRTEVTPDRVYESESSESASLVSQVGYRFFNLEGNEIYLMEPDQQPPDFVARAVRRITQERQPSPGSSSGQLLEYDNLRRLDAPGNTESKIGGWFDSTLFPYKSPRPGLSASLRAPMERYTVPPTCCQYPISTPVPDLLFGYDWHGAFPNHGNHLIALGSSCSATSSMLLMYPFFVVEYGGIDDPLWAAVNQCMGGASSCVHLLERYLQQRLLAFHCQGLAPEDRIAFGMVTNGTEARVHVTWMTDEQKYFTRMLRAFALHEQEQYLLFRQYCENIIDWGCTDRLAAIRDALDRLKDAGDLVLKPRRGDGENMEPELY